MHHLTDRITHTTAFVTPVVEHWLGTEKEFKDLAQDFGSYLSAAISKIHFSNINGVNIILEITENLLFQF